MPRPNVDRSQSVSGKSTRREFVSAAAATALSFTFVPRHVLGGAGYLAPSEKLNFAGIGAGGMGGGDIATVAKIGGNVIALCDVDEQRAAGSFSSFPMARRYKDFREMVDKEAKNVDAFTVGTPDHTHAVATMAAIKAGKHVYCQKPMCHTIREAREVTLAARKAGVATQMGNQGHGTEGARLTNEWIQAGIIGDVTEVHCWSDRAGRLWKQGIPKPTGTPPVPSTLDWDLWLGPVSERPYNPAYAPFAWRGWWDFGTGAIGDMGCHIIDHPVWALKLGAPSHVESRITLDGTQLDKAGKIIFDSFPIASIIYYDFPAREKMPAVRLTWYDGGLLPTPPEMPNGTGLPDNGVLYIGTKGKMYHGSHGGMPQLLPGSLHEAAKQVPKSIPRSIGHYEEWVAAAKGGPKTVCNFDYAGPMTETALLGVLSLRAPGRRLEWDAENLKIKNAPELDQYTHIEYRKGWSL